VKFIGLYGLELLQVGENNAEKNFGFIGCVLGYAPMSTISFTEDEYCVLT